MRLVTTLLVVAALHGCGGAQVALSSQAQIVASTQEARFEFYGAAHEDCLAGASEIAEYRACMAPYRHAARAIDSYRESLYAAQAALRAGTEEGALFACLITAAKRLESALDTANVPVPEEISQLATMIPEGLCDAR